MSFTLVHGKQLRDLRVTKGTGLTVGVASGNYGISGNNGYYAGTASAAVTDSATNYVQLDSSGTLVINTTGFDADNLELAEVVAAGGVVTVVTDRRAFLTLGGGSGGGSSAQWVQGAPTGVIDGVNNIFVLPSAPLTGVVLLSLDGMLLDPGVGDDFTISGTTITFTTPPATGSKLVYFYLEGLSLSGGVDWDEITASQISVINKGYVTNDTAVIELTLPLTSPVGAELRITGKGSGGWKIIQGTGQQIHDDTLGETTLGVTGYLESASQYAALYLVCITADTHWSVESSRGSINVN